MLKRNVYSLLITFTVFYHFRSSYRVDFGHLDSVILIFFLKQPQPPEQINTSFKQILKARVDVSLADLMHAFVLLVNCLTLESAKERDLSCYLISLRKSIPLHSPRIIVPKWDGPFCLQTFQMASRMVRFNKATINCIFYTVIFCLYQSFEEMVGFQP